MKYDTTFSTFSLSELKTLKATIEGEIQNREAEIRKKTIQEIDDLLKKCINLADKYKITIAIGDEDLDEYTNVNIYC